MKKIALIYWPKNGSVEKVSNQLKEKLTDQELLFSDVKTLEIEELMNCDLWIFGGSTVGAHSWMDASEVNYWTEFFKKLNNFNISDKTVAFFGLGDQVHYPHHFVDDLSVFQEEFTSRKAKIIGQWPIEDYNFYESEGVENDFFYGLAIDEDNQSELTDQRLNQWIDLLLK